MTSKINIKNFILKIVGYFLIVFQYLPNSSIWFGIMSLPLISYMFYFFQRPEILWLDIISCLQSIGFYITILGFGFFIYTTIFLFKNRKKLIINGPYKYLRHPQYVGIIFMTFGLTALSLDAYPINPFYPLYPIEFFPKSGILFIWIVEVLLYIILAKIEDFSLKNKYGEKYLDYARNVPFMLPFLNIFKERKK
ncbi:MAG: hypothetical protein EU533_03250 [Promethearchaeota archaeon]|nr:MAG: hypothetical protein EU533_03250 [Candidatus Lokiarchaeota archaeon]